MGDGVKELGAPSQEVAGVAGSNDSRGNFPSVYTKDVTVRMGTAGISTPITFNWQREVFHTRSDAKINLPCYFPCFPLHLVDHRDVDAAGIEGDPGSLQLTTVTTAHKAMRRSAGNILSLWKPWMKVNVCAGCAANGRWPKYSKPIGMLAERCATKTLLLVLRDQNSTSRCARTRF